MYSLCSKQESSPYRAPEKKEVNSDSKEVNSDSKEVNSDSKEVNSDSDDVVAAKFKLSRLSLS